MFKRLIASILALLGVLIGTASPAAIAPRVRIDAPRVRGSISLEGARIDDLVLTDHRADIRKDAPPVRLLAPGGTPAAYFATFGWAGAGRVPGPATVWTADRATLTPAAPVTLRWDNGEGARFALTIAIDADYLFTVRQTVTNRSGRTANLVPEASIRRAAASADPTSWTMHVGPIAVRDGAADYGIDYDALARGSSRPAATTGGWIGFGDKYWLTALVPDQRASVVTAFSRRGGGAFSATVRGAALAVAPGGTATTTVRLFAGGKEIRLLEAYEDRAGIAQFDRAIDWGWFRWFMLPIFHLLDWLFRTTGNFGVAIIGLTACIRLLLFPIVERQFRSMAATRALQPQLRALKALHKDDRAKVDEETVALYKANGIHPAAGCLPLLLQLPIFYALYKVLTLSVEMRHQPFVLWIKDLSAPDPLTPVNLFGLLPFTPTGFLQIGILPILLGVILWFQTRLNGAGEGAEGKVTAIMPWAMMILFAPFAAGLQLYYISSSLIGIAQQMWHDRRHARGEESGRRP